MTEQYLKCPNCGANATNHQNCEYCGSLLVRFVEKGIELSNTTYMTNDGVFPGLAEELRHNLELQNNHFGFIITEINHEIGIKNNDFDLVSVTRRGYTNWEDNTKIISSGKNKGLLILLKFWVGSHELCDNEAHSRFKKLSSSPLFMKRVTQEKEPGVTRYEYALDFGCDAEGAARLISEILQKVYLVPLSENLELFSAVRMKEYKEKYNQARIKRGLEPLEDDGGWPWWVYPAGAIGLYFLYKLFF